MSICIGLYVCNNALELPFVFDSIERIQTILQDKIDIIIAYDESYDTSLGFLLSKLDYFQIHILKNQQIVKRDDRIVTYIRNFLPKTEHLITIQPKNFHKKIDSAVFLQCLCQQEVNDSIQVYPRSVFSDENFVI